MRGTLFFILLATSLNICAQHRSDTVFCGIPQLTGADLKLEKGLENCDPVILLSGRPGPETTIKIRCGYTIQSGNEPLYVVDGVVYEPVQIKSIKPNDIERIDVLKYNAASALYGNRASHGVIIITTKKASVKKFTIKDSKDNTGIALATITATSLKTGNSFSFVANDFGRSETSLLKLLDYKLTITCAGYKSKQVLLSDAAKNNYEIFLERDVIELNEVNIISCIEMRYRTISCRLRCGSTCRWITNKPGKQTNISDKSEFKVYPNPVSQSGTINISFPNVKEGLYQIRLINSAGQLFYSSQKQVTAKNETEQFHLNNQVSAGIYIVQVMDGNKKLVQSSKLIVQ